MFFRAEADRPTDHGCGHDVHDCSYNAHDDAGDCDAGCYSCSAHDDGYDALRRRCLLRCRRHPDERCVPDAHDCSRSRSLRGVHNAVHDRDRNHSARLLCDDRDERDRNRSARHDGETLVRVRSF